MPGPVSLSSALATAALALALVGSGTTPGAASPAPPGTSTGTPTGTPEPTPTAEPEPEPDHEAVPAAEPDPLRITIRNVTPATVPDRGPIRLVGRITNTTTETWTDINVHPFMAGTPMTTAEELAVATVSDPRLHVGDRITAPGTFDTIRELAPGGSAAFTVRVPRSELPVADPLSPGVYWFGVHALGSSPAGREPNAVGRARTFLPRVAPDAGPLEAALVLPVRRKLLHTEDGRVSDVAGWSRDLSEGGHLRRTIDFAAEGGSATLTWLVDPAVLGAVSRLTVGNPPRAVGGATAPPTGGSGEQPTPDPSPTAPPPLAEALQDGAADSTTGRAGLVWLERFSAAIAGHEVLGLPYGDVDSNAAARYDTPLLRAARELTLAEFARLDIPVRPVLAPPSGEVTAPAVRAADPSEIVLVADETLDPETPPAARVRVGGRELVVASAGAASGGPGPDNPNAPTAIRQRILAEAAVRLLDEVPAPLVVVLPDRWNPRGGARFFDGIDQAWLRLVPLSDTDSGPTPELGAEVLPTAPRTARRALGVRNFSAADQLINAGSILQRLLSDETVGRAITGEALSTTSYRNARTPDAARSSAERATRWVRAQLARVTVEAPPYVTLSSDSGRFSVSVTNGLAQPVTVRLEAVTDGPVTVEVPTELELGPGDRTSLLLTASSRGIGVHNVELRVTDLEGTPLGSATEVPIRSAQVSNIIWFVIAGGGLLLLGAVVVRLWRRLRRRPGDGERVGSTA